MTFDQVHGISAPRGATQAYETQKHRFERIKPDAPVSEGNEQRHPTALRREYGFSLGKLGVQLEIEHSGYDPEVLAKVALDRYNRERESAFRTEMEIALLRSAITSPDSLGEGAGEGTGAASAGTETLALPQTESSVPSKHALQLAKRAYEEQDKSFTYYPHLPGVSIGVV